MKRLDIVNEGIVHWSLCTGWSIVVECVQNPRFRKHLASNGWISVGDGFSFFKENF